MGPKAKVQKRSADVSEDEVGNTYDLGADLKNFIETELGKITCVMKDHLEQVMAQQEENHQAITAMRLELVQIWEASEEINVTTRASHQVGIDNVQKAEAIGKKMERIAEMCNSSNNNSAAEMIQMNSRVLAMDKDVEDIKTSAAGLPGQITSLVSIFRSKI